MKYMVVTRWLDDDDNNWHTVDRGFSSMEEATDYAEGMYKAKAVEITVLIYELKKSYN